MLPLEADRLLLPFLLNLVGHFEANLEFDVALAAS
jgi:hypothetical protein